MFRILGLWIRLQRSPRSFDSAADFSCTFAFANPAEQWSNFASFCWSLLASGSLETIDSVEDQTWAPDFRLRCKSASRILLACIFEGVAVLVDRISILGWTIAAISRICPPCVAQFCASRLSPFGPRCSCSACRYGWWKLGSSQPRGPQWGTDSSCSANATACTGRWLDQLWSSQDGSGLFAVLWLRSSERKRMPIYSCPGPY